MCGRSFFKDKAFIKAGKEKLKEKNQQLQSDRVRQKRSRPLNEAHRRVAMSLPEGMSLCPCLYVKPLYDECMDMSCIFIGAVVGVPQLGGRKRSCGPSAQQSAVRPKRVAAPSRAVLVGADMSESEGGDESESEGGDESESESESESDLSLCEILG